MVTKITPVKLADKRNLKKTTTHKHTTKTENRSQTAQCSQAQLPELKEQPFVFPFKTQTVTSSGVLGVSSGFILLWLELPHGICLER